MGPVPTFENISRTVSCVGQRPGVRTSVCIDFHHKFTTWPCRQVILGDFQGGFGHRWRGLSGVLKKSFFQLFSVPDGESGQSCGVLELEGYQYGSGPDF